MTVDEAIEDLTYALSTWLYGHSLDGWLDMDFREVFAYGTGYNHAGADEMQTAMRPHWARLMAEEYPEYYCPDCSEIVEGFNQCPTCYKFIPRITAEWYEDLAFQSESILEGDEDIFTNAMRAAIEEVHVEFVDWFGLTPIIDQMQAALDDLENADTADEALAAFVFAIHVNHASGNITDHCNCLKATDVDFISQNGAEKFFGADEIKDFRESF